MKLELGILDRIIIKTLLPKTANYKDMIISDDIEKKVLLSQEEIKNIDLQITSEGMKWNNNNEKNISADFTDAELNLLKEEIKKIDNDNKIGKEFLPTIKKIGYEG